MAQTILKAADLAKRPGLTLESSDDSLTMNAPLLSGSFLNLELRKGLSVHASDLFEETDFVATSTQNAGLSCIFFIEGNVDVDIGDRTFAFHGGGDRFDGLLVASARPDRFRRRSKGHQHIRHVVISAAPDWLEIDGLRPLGDHRPASLLMRDHLASRPWRLTPRVATLVKRVLVSQGDSQYDQLLLESAAVEIVAEALAAATNQDIVEHSRDLSASERVKLSRVEQIIRMNAENSLNVEIIALQSGLSVSSLQRLFKAAYGTSVIEYIRRSKLEDARTKLEVGNTSIKRAALLAGYSSAANFATAFRRQFGVSPSQMRKFSE